MATPPKQLTSLGAPAKPAATTATATAVPKAVTGIDALVAKYSVGRVKPVSMGSDKQPPESELRYIVAIKGPKAGGKSTLVVGVPRPNGGRTVIIAFDEATRESLRKRYTPEELAHVTLYEVSRPIRDADGKVVYRGYDSSDPRTGEAVIAEAVAILQECERSGDVDVLHIDHFGFMFEGPATSAARFRNNLGPDDRMELQHYGPRADIARAFFHRAKRIPKFWFSISGYGDRETGTTYLKDENGNDLIVNGKKKVGKGTKTATWYEKVQEDILLTLEAEKITTDSGEAWEVYVEQSYMPRFRTGERRGVTGKNLALWWEQDAKMDAVEKAVMS